MNYNNNDNGMWDWQCQDYSLEDNTGIEISESLLNGINQNIDQISYGLDEDTTPVKACGDLVHHVTSNEVIGKDLEQYRDPYSQVKRRRMLQFEPEVMDASLCNDDSFLRSKEIGEFLEDGMSEMAVQQWVATFTEGTSSEGWVTECLNDPDMDFCSEDISAFGASDDVQIDIMDLCDTPPEYDANEVQKQPVHSHKNVVFKGKKSFIRPPPRIASSVVYPFAFIKPCGALGDVTLKDINQKIHNPPKSKTKEKDHPAPYPTSAFSGKPVVGKTKIHTEGGKGSITIMRTKG